MAHWHLHARVIDTGVIEMGSYFVTHNGVKVITPDGKRHFLGRVMMHNEINSLFTETEGDFVDMYFAGSGKGLAPVLYGMKTTQEDAYNKASPMIALKAQCFQLAIYSFFLCFLLIGFLLIPLCLIWYCYLCRWNPPSRKTFDHLPAGPMTRLSGNSNLAGKISEATV